MNKMKKQELIIFILITLVTMLCFLPIIIGHYSTDTYRLIEMGYKEYAIKFSLNDGRIFMSLIGLIASKINIGIILYVSILTTIGILISNMCVLKIYKIVNRDKEKINYLLLCISYITIYNCMYLENLYFTECIVMALSIYLFILAADKLVNKDCFFIPLLLTIIGVFCYQGTINFFITFSFLLVIIKEKKINKKVIVKMEIVLVICLCSMILNIIQVKICGMLLNLEQTRTGGVNLIIDNIKYMISNLDELILKHYIFPKGLLFLFWIITIISVLIYEYKNDNNSQNIINLILLTIIAVVSSILINIVSLSSFALARMIFSIGALEGLFYIYIYSNMEILSKKNYKIIFIIIFITYLIINIYNTESILIKHKIANRLDKEEALKVNEIITEYEDENNVKIENISISVDKNVTWTYKKLNDDSPYSHRALMIWWDNVEVINYYTGRHLKRVDMDKDIYIKYFKNKNWDELDKEQFVFEGNTLYCCSY